MDTYKHGFVVKSQKELEEMMGPLPEDGWRNPKNKFSDAFISDMIKYIGAPSFQESAVFVETRGSKVSAFGWNFDTRWVHELKRCTFEELIDSSIPFNKVYAVCVPDDIFERISMRAGSTKDDVDLVPSDVAVALKNTMVPDHSFIYLTLGAVDVIDYLGHLWLPNELEVLYTKPLDPKVIIEVDGEEYLSKYKGKGISYHVTDHPLGSEVESFDMSIFDKTYKTHPDSCYHFVILDDEFFVELSLFKVKVEVDR